MRFCTLLAFGLLAAGEPGPEPPVVAKPEAYPTLVNPNCSHCRDEAKRRAGELLDKDPVLCWVRGKYEGGAIPIRFFLNRYRVISDTYGVFVYDPDAGYARGYEPSLDFTFHGWRNGVMVMRHKDGTLYSCLSGVAFDGPRKGSRLTPIPTLVSQWGFWLEHYPGGVAYHMYDRYQSTELPTKAEEDSRRSRGVLDDRLAAETPVLGVTLGPAARAYALDRLEKVGVLQDRLNDRAIVVLWHGPTKTAAAFEPLASPPQKDAGLPRRVTIVRDEAEPGAPFRDQETGSHWDITGRAVQGDLKGWTLTWLDGTQVKWFAWAAEYPQTSLVFSPLGSPPERGID